MRKTAKVLLALLLVFSIFPRLSFAAQDASFNEDLEVYLQEISEIRGFEVTTDHIEKELTLWDVSIDDFETVAELSAFLAEVIKADYSNLDPILESYELTLEELQSLLAENGESLDDFVFVDGLVYTISFYLYPEGEIPGEVPVDEELVEDLLITLNDEFGLTETEINQLTEHLMSLEEKLSTPESLEKLESLAERMMAIGDFETLDDLTAEQIQEFLSIYDELMQLFELKIDFTLIKNDQGTPVTIWDVLIMKELINAKLKIAISDLSGNLLADLIITGEMIDSEVVEEIGEEVDQATEEAKEQVSNTIQTPQQVKTEKGGKLPNTAGNFASNGLIGLVLLASGVLVYRNTRKAC